MIQKIIINFLILFFSCSSDTYKNNFDIELYIRNGFSYHSILLDKDGKGYIKKGKSSYYDKDFKNNKVEDSATIVITSIDTFLEKLDSLKHAPIKTKYRLDASRVEIYYDQKKIYDSYSWNSEFWNLINPIINQLPDRLNPFINPDRK